MGEIKKIFFLTTTFTNSPRQEALSCFITIISALEEV